MQMLSAWFASRPIGFLRNTSVIFHNTYNLGGPCHPVIVTTKDNKDDIRDSLYSYETTVAGCWGILLNNNNKHDKKQ